MPIEYNLPSELRLFLNHIYEFKKGVRNMVLYTLRKEYTEYAIQRLELLKSGRGLYPWNDVGL